VPATRVRWQNLARAAAIAAAAIAIVMALPSLLSADSPPPEPDVGLIAAEPELPPPAAGHAPPGLSPPAEAPGGDARQRAARAKAKAKAKAKAAARRASIDRGEEAGGGDRRRRERKEGRGAEEARSGPPSAYVPPAPVYHPPVAPVPARVRDGFSFER
jgi:hypothetical protein